VKVEDLVGEKLNHWVAKAEGLVLGKWLEEDTWYKQPSKREYIICKAKHWEPSSVWAQGGPIIDRERIKVDPGGAEWTASMSRDNCVQYIHVGETALIAAMRCFVASRYGDEVP